MAAEELTAVDINVPTTLLATGLGLQPIIGFGSEDQKRIWLGEILAQPADRLAAFAFTEVTGGANFDSPDPQAGVQTFARLDGDEGSSPARSTTPPMAAAGTARVRICCRWCAARIRTRPRVNRWR